MKRIPFDSLCVLAVSTEIGDIVSARVQKVFQLDDYTIVLELYDRQRRYLLISCHPVYPRVYFLSSFKKRENVLTSFCQEARKNLQGARLVNVRQRGFDRILEFTFSTHEGDCFLIVELMGTRSNLLCLDSTRRIASAIRWSKKGAERKILPGARYEFPASHKKPFSEAQFGDSLMDYEGMSPFLARLIEQDSSGKSLEVIKSAILKKDFVPVYSVGFGAYPISIGRLGYEEKKIDTLSEGLALHFEKVVSDHTLIQKKNSLLGIIKKLKQTKELVIKDLSFALNEADSARKYQQMGELILTYAHTLKTGADKLETFDFEGNAISIKLNPELKASENAQKFFKKAKKSLERRPYLEEQLAQIRSEYEDLCLSVNHLEHCEDLADLDKIWKEAEEKKWLQPQPKVTAKKEERPFEGHKIRKSVAPGNFVVLYGENATANQYLITRVARPNDYWFHVRGATSSHVIIQTNNKPERVQVEALEFAAQIAKQKSSAKHASYVPVDYTLAKFVRRIKGGAIGSVTYSREKTIYIEN